MGYYTEISTELTLVKDVPEDVLHVLKGLFGILDPENKEALNRFYALIENFGPNFRELFNRSSHMTYDDTTGCWYIKGCGEIKNYDGEIYSFFSWIEPYTHAPYLGTYQYEDAEEATLVPTKVFIKQEVIKALSAFITTSNMKIYSCVAVEEAVHLKVMEHFYGVKYRLTPEVLYASEDSHEYATNKVIRTVSTTLPFTEYRFHTTNITPQHSRQLRKRFCELSLRNLESGVFDIDVDAITFSEKKRLLITLILTK